MKEERHTEISSVCRSPSRVAYPSSPTNPPAAPRFIRPRELSERFSTSSFMTGAETIGDISETGLWSRQRSVII